MRVFREPEEPDFGKDALTFALGAMGGLAIGMLIGRRPLPQQASRLGEGLRERARSVTRRLRPARLRRMAVEQDELTALEDAVLDAFLADDTLSERGIDVGAISVGIIELSGTVWTEGEAQHAVRAASAVPGVRTVVNRMDIEDQARRFDRGQREDETSDGTFQRSGIGGVGGMGRRRQGRETDPETNDDSQPHAEAALRDADVDQWVDEGFGHENLKKSSRSEVQSANRTNFSEDELDNQDPHGKHAAYTLDDQPQDLNTQARVGEGLKSGEHLILEQADLPVKPHGGDMGTQGESQDDKQEG